MFDEEIDFNELLRGGIIQQYRDMLDDSAGLPSEQAILEGLIESPLGEMNISEMTPTDEASGDLFDEDMDFADEDMEQQEADQELADAKSRAQMSTTYQERMANRGRGKM